MTLTIICREVAKSCPSKNILFILISFLQQRILAKIADDILYFQTPTTRVRSFSSFSRVISDNARKVLQFTNVRAAEITGNINTDFRGSDDYCLNIGWIKFEVVNQGDESKIFEPS